MWFGGGRAGGGVGQLVRMHGEGRRAGCAGLSLQVSRKEGKGATGFQEAQALDPITGLAFTPLFSCITDAPAFVGPLQCGLCAAHRRIGWVGAFEMLLALCSAPLS